MYVCPLGLCNLPLTLNGNFCRFMKLSNTTRQLYDRKCQLARPVSQEQCFVPGQWNTVEGTAGTVEEELLDILGELLDILGEPLDTLGDPQYTGPERGEDFAHWRRELQQSLGDSHCNTSP